jgi:hypothetical protein
VRYKLIAAAIFLGGASLVATLNHPVHSETTYERVDIDRLLDIGTQLPGSIQIQADWVGLMTQPIPSLRAHDFAAPPCLDMFRELVSEFHFDTHWTWAPSNSLSRLCQELSARPNLIDEDAEPVVLLTIICPGEGQYAQVPIKSSDLTDFFAALESSVATDDSVGSEIIERLHTIYTNQG